MPGFELLDGLHRGFVYLCLGFVDHENCMNLNPSAFTRDGFV